MDHLNSKEKLRIFYENWKRVIRDPKISIYTKVVLHNIFLYRSDSKGWCLSERKLAKDLGVGKETVSKAIDEAIKLGLLHKDISLARKRRRLWITGSLQTPASTPIEPSNWTSTKPSKYLSKYQSNSFSENNYSNTMSGDELHKKLEEFKAKGYKKINLHSN